MFSTNVKVNGMVLSKTEESGENDVSKDEEIDGIVLSIKEEKNGNDLSKLEEIGKFQARRDEMMIWLLVG